MAKTFEALQKNHISSDLSTEWQFLDLANKKQLGDLDKKILHLKQKNEFKVYNFTSSRGREGVSTILVNLLNYIKFHKSAKNILVIDANMQRPALHTVLRCPNDKGLTDVMSGNLNVDEVSYKVENTPITIVPSGKGHKSMSGNIEQGMFSDFLEKNEKDFDYIFIDSAAVLTSSDALSTASLADTTFLIVQSLKVQKEVGLKAKSLLQNNECEISGVILNEVEQVIPNWMYKLL